MGVWLLWDEITTVTLARGDTLAVGAAALPYRPGCVTCAQLLLTPLLLTPPADNTPAACADLPLLTPPPPTNSPQVRPGIITKDSEGRVKCIPIYSRIVSLLAEQNVLQVRGFGGERGRGGAGFFLNGSSTSMGVRVNVY